MKAIINNQNCFIDWAHFTDEDGSQPKGTQCRISDTTPSHTVLAVGQTILSKKDQFDKKIGRKLSLKRALEAGSVSKQERKVIWNNYLNNDK